MSGEREGLVRVRIPTPVLSTTAGHVALGGAAFALVFAGPRELGVDGYSQLAVAWTMIGLVGVALAQPTEQARTRALAAGEPPPAAHARLLATATLLVSITVLGMAPAGILLSGSWAWSAAVVVGVVGWAVAALSRADLAGLGLFSAYSVTLLAEAVTRIALVVAAVVTQATELLLQAALGIPLLVSAAVAVLARWRSGVARPRGVQGGGGREQGGITAVAVLAQVSLTTPPLWIQWLSPDAAAAGAFVTVTNYLRVPVILVGGVGVVTLATVSEHHASGARDRVQATVRRVMVGTAVAALVPVAVLLVLSGPLLTILYGQPPGVPWTALILIGASTVLAMVAGVGTQVLFALRRVPPAVLIWALAAIAATACFAASTGAATVVAVGLMLGQTVALAGVALVLARVI